MKAFAITSPGLEEYSSKEISELIGCKTKIEDSVVLFDADEKKLAHLCYKAQSLIKVCSLLQTFKLDSPDDLKKIKVDFTKIIPKGKTFRVKFSRQGDVDFIAQEIEPQIGEIILEQFKNHPKVSLDNPDVIVYAYVYNSNAYLGIDYAGFDLGKRDYRVFANPKSYHGNVAYSLLKIADFKDKETLLDTFCLSGEIGIEAALNVTKRSPHYFSKSKFAFNKFMKFDFNKADKEMKKSKARIVLSSPAMNDVRASQKNAKIASVEKEIEFTRQDIEWIDFKFKKKETVDKIVTIIPCPSSNVAEQSMKKTYDDFFFQVKYLLSKKGKVVVLGRNLLYLKKLIKGFKIHKGVHFFNGKEGLEVVVFSKV